MKISSSIIALVFNLPHSSGFSFQGTPSNNLSTHIQTFPILTATYATKNDNTGYDNDDEDFSMIMGSNNENLPSTTFGAEAVPEGQRPANEYLDLLNSPLFGWASEQNGSKGLGIRLAVLYAVFFGVVCYPISGATFTQEGYELNKIAASNVGAMGIVLLLLVRLYSGWGYVGSRLTSKVIEFEETGWYDGDLEEKTESEKARDLFLYRQNVEPVVQRLKLFTLGAGATWVASCLALNVISNAKPLFNEYDPDLLETLVYDEKMAGIAAEQSNGRPTYCNSRYYRAVANGGQGCN